MLKLKFFLYILFISKCLLIECNVNTNIKNTKYNNNHSEAIHWGYRNPEKSILPYKWSENSPKCN